MAAREDHDLSVNNLFNVKSKIALVTGGGSGIGEMIATALVQNGAKVYIASRKEKQLKEVSEALNKKGPGSCHYLVADVGSKAGCNALAAAFKAKESKLHILVNNSGSSWGAPFDDFPEEEGWDRLMALNVKAIFYLTSNLASLLEMDATAFDPGRVINISSIASINLHAEGSGLAGPGKGLWSYSASKAAVNHLSSTLATTLARRHITVNTICPGIFPSKMTAFGIKEHKSKLEARQPMGRLGDAIDMGGTVLFLVSRAGSHVTDAKLVLDGGSLIFNAATRARL